MPWNCAACTFTNHVGLTTCEVCETPHRTYAQIVTGNAASKWLHAQLVPAVKAFTGFNTIAVNSISVVRMLEKISFDSLLLVPTVPPLVSTVSAVSFLIPTVASSTDGSTVVDSTSVSTSIPTATVACSNFYDSRNAEGQHHIRVDAPLSTRFVTGERT